MFYVFIFRACKDLISLLRSGLIIFFWLSFFISNVNIFDMSSFMSENLYFFNFATEVLMTPFDSVLHHFLFFPWVVGLFTYFIVYLFFIFSQSFFLPHSFIDSAGFLSLYWLGSESFWIFIFFIMFFVFFSDFWLNQIWIWLVGNDLRLQHLIIFPQIIYFLFEDTIFFLLLWQLHLQIIYKFS